MSKLSQLEALSSKEFGIELSLAKMFTDAEYRQLVISELSQLSHPEITQITTWLQNTHTESALVTSSGINAITSKKVPYLLFGAISLCVLLVIFYGFNGQNSVKDKLLNTTVIAEKSTLATTEPLVAENKAIATVITSPANNLPINTAPVETLFRLHGSNTIGEKLAPLLLEGFIKAQGISNYYWKKHHPLERELHYTIGEQKYAIQLHAHGSSTAFASLNDGVADIGMSSRRIKNKEITLLSTQVGHLNKLGNEHIIGLDGLAVIVNQNNSVKQLTGETLAKIFSGEITHWSQLGGSSAAIQLFARDDHSGTWDTFKNLVLKKHNKKLAASATRLESSSELSTRVSQNEAAIGFIGLNYVLHNKAVAIAESKSTSAIYPTRFTVGTEDYPLSRRLYFYTPTSASKVIKDFAQYALSMQGQEIVAEAGLISQNIKLEQIHPLKDAPKKYNEYTKTAKRLSLNFRFDYATKDLDNKGKRDLQRLVKFMENHDTKRIILMGFSDSIGAKIKNTALSLNRAKSVELALVSRGINVLAVEGMGEALPIANNDTEAGRKRNRRVEVWVL